MELDTLPQMFEEMRRAPEVVQPSRYWSHLNELNMDQLVGRGFAEFKRTVNRNYFQFQQAGLRSPQFRAVARRWLRSPRLGVLGASLAEPLDSGAGGVLARALANRSYAVYLAMLREYVLRRAGGHPVATLEEPLLGRPAYIEHRGHRVSEDLCNSALEFISIGEGLGRTSGIRSVMELGAGYGRLAWVFLSLLPEVRYTIVDIPPALAVAERYLRETHPERRVFGFRRFESFEEIADDLGRAELAFLTPNQLDLLPPQAAELFINVSSLHEMRPDQIEHYFGVISRHCAGGFYSKQWLRSVNDRDKVVIARDDYPIPAHWRVVFDRRHAIQVEFFEAFYAVGAKSTLTST
jgi:putative sugar O-methyltransferase